jgi:hypothetical protein
VTTKKKTKKTAKKTVKKATTKNRLETNGQDDDAAIEATTNKIAIAEAHLGDLQPPAIAPCSRIEFVIRFSLPGYLQNSQRLRVQMEKESSQGLKVVRTPAEEAPWRTHWIDEAKGLAGIPSEQLYSAFVQAGSNFNVKGQGQKRMSDIVASTVSFEEDMIPLLNDDGSPAQYEVFEKFARIPPKKGPMVLIGRPLFKNCIARFVMRVDHIGWGSMNQVSIIFGTGGRLIGIGAYRVANKGPFGKWEIESAKVIEII